MVGEAAAADAEVVAVGAVAEDTTTITGSTMEAAMTLGEAVTMAAVEAMMLGVVAEAVSETTIGLGEVCKKMSSKPNKF